MLFPGPRSVGQVSHPVRLHACLAGSAAAEPLLPWSLCRGERGLSPPPSGVHFALASWVIAFISQGHRLTRYHLVGGSWFWGLGVQGQRVCRAGFSEISLLGWQRATFLPCTSCGLSSENMHSWFLVQISSS